MPRRTAVLLAAAVIALLAGCALPGGRPGGDRSGDAASTRGPNASPPDRGSGSSAGTGIPGPPTPGPALPTAETTLTGTVREGVERGCLLLSSGGTAYLLLGGDRAVLKPGTSVKVRGRPTPGVVTTCMQGVPFQVTGVSPR